MLLMAGEKYSGFGIGMDVGVEVREGDSTGVVEEV